MGGAGRARCDVNKRSVGGVTAETRTASAATARRGDGADAFDGSPLSEDVLTRAISRFLRLAMKPLDSFPCDPRPQPRQVRKNPKEIVATCRLRHPHQCINRCVEPLEHGPAMALRVELQIVGLQEHLIRRSP